MEKSLKSARRDVEQAIDKLRATLSAATPVEAIILLQVLEQTVAAEKLLVNFIDAKEAS